MVRHYNFSEDQNFLSLMSIAEIAKTYRETYVLFTAKSNTSHFCYKNRTELGRIHVNLTNAIYIFFDARGETCYSNHFSVVNGSNLEL